MSIERTRNLPLEFPPPFASPLHVAAPREGFEDLGELFGRSKALARPLGGGTADDLAADAVARRHAKDSPFIAALAPSVEARSLAFIEEYERLRTRGNPRAALIAVQLALAKDVRGWLTLVAYHVTDVDRGKFTGNPEVPEDLVGDAERLIEIVDRHEAEHGPLHFGEQLRANLTADIAAVRDRHDDHGGAVTDETATRRALNDAASELRRVIAALRSAMKLALGAEHPATRSLRVRTRGAKADEEVAEGDSLGSEQPDAVPAE